MASPWTNGFSYYILHSSALRSCALPGMQCSDQQDFSPVNTASVFWHKAMRHSYSHLCYAVLSINWTSRQLTRHLFSGTKQCGSSTAISAMLCCRSTGLLVMRRSFDPLSAIIIGVASVFIVGNEIISLPFFLDNLMV